MAGIDNMKARLNYRGGASAEGRFQKDKLNTLKKALLYSYQAETIELEDGRQFRCLINRDKLSEDYDDKIVSIPFQDICLNQKPGAFGPTSQGEQEVGLKVGDIFSWVRTNTNWLVTLQYLEEDAYFRADIRKCTGEVIINGKKYWAYLRGPGETDLVWKQKSHALWNESNCKLILYIQSTEETREYFRRFKKVEVDGEIWEVRVVNRFYGGGKMLRVCLGETFVNEFEEENSQDKPEVEETLTGARIEGNTIIYPFDIVNYSIVNAQNGEWKVSNNKAKIINASNTEVTIEVVTGKSGSFDLEYVRSNGNVVTLPVTIDSL